uniref:Ovule protein n=1 Tax=Parascaris univalens TaxID=6257 RepID=A0A914ZMZ8_PARUN
MHLQMQCYDCICNDRCVHRGRQSHLQLQFHSKLVLLCWQLYNDFNPFFIWKPSRFMFIYAQLIRSLNE